MSQLDFDLFKKNRTVLTVQKSYFYRQICNINIQMSRAEQDQVAGIHWQVAQATSISNVNIIMTEKGTSTQVGICKSNFNVSSALFFIQDYRHLLSFIQRDC